jgi:hypothetical protein
MGGTKHARIDPATSVALAWLGPSVGREFPLKIGCQELDEIEHISRLGGESHATFFNRH